MFKLNAIKIYAVILLALIAAFYFLQNKINAPKEEVVISLRDYLLSSLISELPDINKNLPIKIDDQTSLLSVSFNSNNVISIYELVKFDGNINAIGEFKSALSKQVCSDDMKKKLLDVDVNFLNRYKNQSGDIIFDILVTKEICLKN